MRVKRYIPFSWLPASWGLHGKVRREAEAAYYFTGYDLDKALIDIEFDDNECVEKQIKLITAKIKHGVCSKYVGLSEINSLNNDEYNQLNLDHEFGIIDDKTHQLKLVDYTHRAEDREIAKLDIMHKFGDISEKDYLMKQVELSNASSVEKDISYLKIRNSFGEITDTEMEKGIATLKNEPWVDVVHSGFDKSKGINGFQFEMDWNAQWIETLRASGYEASSDQDVMDMWFTDVCNSVNMDVPIDAYPDNIPFNLRGSTRYGGSEFS